ncbi:MAG: DUF3859 domain-containing protein [Desulfovibrio sp.]|nr:MAG: DUF3859 domain-containing protein [Desulfovibrio sp.]
MVQIQIIFSTVFLFFVLAGSGVQDTALAQSGDNRTVSLAPGVELLHAGIFASEPSHEPFAHADEVCPPPPFALQQETFEIPAALSLRFGFVLSISGETGEVREITVQVEHPVWRDPVRQEHERMETWRAWACAGQATYVGWEFTYEWELAAGPWTITVLDNGAELAKVSFSVLDPGGDHDLQYGLEAQ